MYFPGENYRLYLAIRVANQQVLDACEANDLRRFFLPEIANQRRKVAQTINELSTSWCRDDYELTVEQDNHVTVYTPGRKSAYPKWSLKSGNFRELMKLLQGDEYVFIHNEFNGTILKTISFKDPIKKEARIRTRELWEVLRESPTRGIVYGCYNPQIFYGYGMAGAVVSPMRVSARNGYTTWNTNGRYIEVDDLNLKIIAEKLGLPERYHNDVLAICIAMNKKIPSYMKDTYENLDRESDYAKACLDEGFRLYQRDSKAYPDAFLHNATTQGALASVKNSMWFTWYDRRLCDHCSVAYACRLYRRGAVCGVPGSENYGLAKKFNTRDVETIIDGISEVLTMQAMMLEEGCRDLNRQRLKALADDEEMPSAVDMNLSKLMDAVQRNGIQYAKLLNPKLTTSVVQVSVEGGDVQRRQIEITQRMASEAIRELEARGHDRSTITEGMIHDHIISKNGGAEIVEAPVIDGMQRDF